MDTAYPLKLDAKSEGTRYTKHIRSVVYHVGVILLGFLMLYPVLWLVSSSLKPADQIWGQVSSLIPRELHFENLAGKDSAALRF
jgi:multiple sugar transport system permease protein